MPSSLLLSSEKMDLLDGLSNVCFSRGLQGLPWEQGVKCALVTTCPEEGQAQLVLWMDLKIRFLDFTLFLLSD